MLLQTTEKQEADISLSPLGKQLDRKNSYAPEILFAISRQPSRTHLKIPENLLFRGYDVWNAFEISWLNMRGKPIVALGEFIVPCDTPNLIESKSMKLYLNSLASTRFPSIQAVKNTITQDLSATAKGNITVQLIPLYAAKNITTEPFDGLCLDTLDVECDVYQVTSDLLTVEPSSEIVEEKIYTNLLRSNCLVTHQPDWGTIFMHYQGRKISHEGFLKYIVSFRQHDELHEQCIERIFMDILTQCKPQKLTIEGRYTRRGGIDINPYRTNYQTGLPRNRRLIWQ